MDGTMDRCHAYIVRSPQSANRDRAPHTCAWGSRERNEGVSNSNGVIVFAGPLGRQRDRLGLCDHSTLASDIAGTVGIAILRRNRCDVNDPAVAVRHQSLDALQDPLQSQRQRGSLSARGGRGRRGDGGRRMQQAALAEPIGATWTEPWPQAPRSQEPRTLVRPNPPRKFGALSGSADRLPPKQATSGVTR